MARDDEATSRRRVTFIMDEDDHALLCGRCEALHEPVSRVLERAARAVAHGRLVFWGWDPTLIKEDGTVVSVPLGRAASIKDSGSSKKVTAEEYKRLVHNLRMGDPGFEEYAQDDLEGWIRVAVDDWKYNEASLRELIKMYPPHLGSPSRKKTDKFLGLEA